MPDFLIRRIDAQVLKRLKVRARRHGRSLQREAQVVLEQAAGAGADEVAVILDEWKRRFAGRRFSSSVRLIREDRNR
jgi:plasmid stability protein